MHITGVVKSGLGVGTQLTQLPWFVEAIWKLAEFRPYPGTLNLALSDPGQVERLLIQEGTVLVPPTPAHCCAELRMVSFRRTGSTGGIDEAGEGVIVRPRVRGYDPTQLELVSPVNLRERLHLMDGDSVTLEPTVSPGPSWLQGVESTVPGVRHGQVKRTGLLSTGEIRFQAHWTATGHGVTVTLVGGLPHVGAVALASPRPSLRDPSRPSATSSVLTLLGHKDDLIARTVAERLASQLNQNVSVSVGIHAGPAGHYDLTEGDLAAVVAAVEAITQELYTQIVVE